MNQITFATVFVIFQITSVCDAVPRNLLVTMPSMPSECTGKNFCSIKHPDYPENTIENLLEGTENLFDDLVGSPLSNYVTDLLPRDCQINLSINPIYEIIDENDQLRFVVQSQTKFRQITRIEECRNPGRIVGNTYNFSASMLRLISLMCVQEYLHREFVVLSLDGKLFETVRVKGGLPSYCACRIET